MSGSMLTGQARDSLAAYYIPVSVGASKKPKKSKKKATRKVGSKDPEQTIRLAIEKLSSAKQINPRRGAAKRSNKHRTKPSCDKQETPQDKPETAESIQEITGNVQKINHTKMKTNYLEKYEGTLSNPVKKASFYYSKIMDNLYQIEEHLMQEDEIEEDHSPEVYKKKKHKTTEFAVRFYRNYTYQLKRRVAELKLAMRTPLELVNAVEKNRLVANALSAYNTAMQSLNVYVCYVSSPQVSKLPDKLCEFIRVLLSLHSLCNEMMEPLLRGHEDLGKLEQKCKSIIAKASFNIYQNQHKEEKQLKGSSSSRNVKESDKDYSMYKSKFTLPNMAGQTSERIARARFGAIVTNRKKKESRKKELKATAKAVEKVFAPDFESLRSSEVIGRPKKESTLNKCLMKKKLYDEDVIETVVQSIASTDDEVHVQEADMCLDSELDDKLTRNMSAVELKHLIVKAIEKLDSVQQNNNPRISQFLTKEPLENAKNVRLICMKSKDMISPDNKVDSFIEKEDVKEQQETDLLIEEATKETFQSIKKPMVFRQLDEFQLKQMRPKNVWVNLKIIEASKKFKKNFKKYRNENNVYGTPKMEKPWEFIGRVSDRFVEEAIIQVASECRIDEGYISRVVANELLDI